MNIKLQRAIDRFVGTPICALLSLVDRLHGRPVVTATPRRILVILLSEMGSLILTYLLFARLKQKYPHASIHVLVFAKNRGVLDILGEISKENVLTLDDRSLIRFAMESFRVLRTLRSRKIDTVIDCELFSRVSSIFSYLSGAQIRVGFHRYTQEGLYRGSFINRAVMYNHYQHLSQQFLTMAEAIESTTVPLAKRAPSLDLTNLPKLIFTEEELQQIVTRLHDDFPAVRDRRLILVYPSGGVLAIRAWPLEYYARLCADLLGDGHAVGIVGLKEDSFLGQTITAYCHNPLCIDLTGYTKSVRHLLALCHRASLLVTNDGGPGHFAALTPIATIVLFGPETPVLYRPLTNNAYCFYLSMSCSPCLTACNHRTSPCDGDNQCLKQITPERVLAKAREFLGAPPKAETAVGKVA